MSDTLIYSGKAKDIYQTDDENLIIARYKDQVTMLNGARKEIMVGKGALNNQISSLIFKKLADAGIATHFVRQVSEVEQLNQKVEIIPLEVVLRNYSAGSFAKRFGLSEGTLLPEPIVEFYYKNDLLDDPFVNDEHIAFLGIATKDEIVHLKNECRRINEVLIGVFAKIGLRLADYKLEFGRDRDGGIILADEVSPDTCRLWDAEGNSMDKDVFRRDLGDLLAVYRVVLEKLQGLN